MINTKETTIPFNLNFYLTGEYRVATHSGLKVNILTTNAEEKTYKVKGHIGKSTQLESWTIQGKYFPLENLSKVSSSLTVTLSKTLGANLEIHRVLKKDISYKKEFVEILNKDFNTNLKVEELKDEAELDYLPLLEEEVFNFKNKIS